MKIAIGCDHIVTDVKMRISEHLKDLGHEVIDFGTYDKHRTHYPIFGKLTAESVVKQEADLGVVLCGTGVGISVSANKTPGARVALVRDTTSARIAKQQYNCNLIAVGGAVTGIDLIKNIVETFINTAYTQSDENEALIRQIDHVLESEDVHYTDDMFDLYLEKWNEGAYQD